METRILWKANRFVVPPSGGSSTAVSIARALIHDLKLLLWMNPLARWMRLPGERMNLELLRIWQEAKKMLSVCYPWD